MEGPEAGTDMWATDRGLSFLASSPQFARSAPAAKLQFLATPVAPPKIHTLDRATERRPDTNNRSTASGSNGGCGLQHRNGLSQEAGDSRVSPGSGIFSAE
jgi:hypothetical protein